MIKNDKLMEFIRYCFVGGVSFVFDFAAFWAMNAFLFIPMYGESFAKENFWTVATSVTVGFIVGLIVNYLLSMLWVFTTKTQQKQGRNTKAFIIFTVIGVIGYGLKLLLMKLQVEIVGMNENIANMIAAVIVLAWNYGARKVIIFRETDERQKEIENAVER